MTGKDLLLDESEKFADSTQSEQKMVKNSRLQELQRRKTGDPQMISAKGQLAEVYQMSAGGEQACMGLLMNLDMMVTACETTCKQGDDSNFVGDA